MSRRSHVTATLLLVLMAAVHAPAQARGMLTAKRVTAQGRVLAITGEGMAAWPVTLVGTQRYVELKRFSSGGGVASQARVLTDQNGYFSIDVPRDRHYQFWFLRFAESGHLDPVKYLTPDDIEITADARRGRTASVEVVIREHPDWPDVLRRVAEAGGEKTAKGKVLRALGLPEKTVPSGVNGLEEWWYFGQGIVYTFRGDVAVSRWGFEPVKAPQGAAPAQATSASGGGGA